MSKQDLPTSTTPQGFPKSIGRPANSALLSEGITTLAQLVELSETELLSIHGVGPKTIRTLEEELAKKNLHLKE